MTASRWASILIAAAFLFASGAMYHSLATDSAQMEVAAARVELVPKTIGPWQGIDEPPDEASFAQTGAKQYWIRTYTHQESRASVLAILMCGRAGKMAVHTPEVCYQGAGYELQGSPTLFTLPTNTSAQMWSARFEKRVGRPSQLRLYWAWNARGTWEAAASPRWEFRGEPFLYKLYVSHEIASPTRAEADPTPAFLDALIPVLQKALFPS